MLTVMPDNVATQQTPATVSAGVRPTRHPSLRIIVPVLTAPIQVWPMRFHPPWQTTMVTCQCHKYQTMSLQWHGIGGRVLSML